MQNHCKGLFIINTLTSLPILVSTAVSVLFYPDYWPNFYPSFIRAQQAARFFDWNFEKLLGIQTSELRKIIFGYLLFQKLVGAAQRT